MFVLRTCEYNDTAQYYRVVLWHFYWYARNWTDVQRGPSHFVTLIPASRKRRDISRQHNNTTTHTSTQNHNNSRLHSEIRHTPPLNNSRLHSETRLSHQGNQKRKKLYKFWFNQEQRLRRSSPIFTAIDQTHRPHGRRKKQRKSVRFFNSSNDGRIFSAQLILVTRGAPPPVGPTVVVVVMVVVVVVVTTVATLLGAAPKFVLKPKVKRLLELKRRTFLLQFPVPVTLLRGPVVLVVSLLPLAVTFAGHVSVSSVAGLHAMAPFVLLLFPLLPLPVHITATRSARFAEASFVAEFFAVVFGREFFVAGTEDARTFQTRITSAALVHVPSPKVYKKRNTNHITNIRNQSINQSIQGRKKEKKKAIN